MAGCSTGMCIQETDLSQEAFSLTRDSELVTLSAECKMHFLASPSLSSFFLCLAHFCSLSCTSAQQLIWPFF